MNIAPRVHAYSVGQDDFGHHIIRDRWFLVATEDDGHRQQHDHVFTEEADAVKLAAKVQAHVDAGGELNPDHWFEIEPAYGSVAYQELDASGYWREREFAEDAFLGGELSHVC